VPALCAAQRVVFLVTGAGKAEAAARAFGAGAGAGDVVPAALVRSAGGSTVAVLDAAAAARLRD
jgi:6-phosphogluconolactonase/glucosamine-6-phosphate isomerase/deaminase